MPSAEHEIPIEFFKNRPELAPLLLETAFGYEVPKYTGAVLSSADCTDTQPRDFRADAVITLSDPEGRPSLTVVIEVQRERDDRKPFSWPVYLATVRARLECPAVLLVLCEKRATARWAAQPIDTGHPDWMLRPLVLGPSNVPVVTSSETARAEPELSALSALVHGAREDGVLLAFAEALTSISDDRFALYYDHVVASLSAAARTHWEALMANGGYVFKTEFARMHQQKGEERGEARGEARALLRILRARSVHVDEATRGRIMECADQQQLETWIDRALTATRSEDLFS